MARRRTPSRASRRDRRPRRDASSTRPASGGATSSSETAGSSPSRTSIDAPERRDGARRGRLRRRARPRRPPHPPARAGRRDRRDGRVGLEGRRPRRLHGRGRHAEHRAGHRLGRRRARRARARRDGAGRGRRRRAPSRSAGGASASPRWREMAALGVRLFTDDGRGVQNAGLMRRALEYARVSASCSPSTARTSTLAAGGHMHEGAWSSRLGIAGPAGARRGGDAGARPRARAAHRRPDALPPPVHRRRRRARSAGPRPTACRSPPR